jgi:hypothetical protein
VISPQKEERRLVVGAGPPSIGTRLIGATRCALTSDADIGDEHVGLHGPDTRCVAFPLDLV